MVYGAYDRVVKGMVNKFKEILYKPESPKKKTQSSVFSKKVSLLQRILSSKKPIKSPKSFELSLENYTSFLPYVKKVATWVVEYKMKQAGIPKDVVCKGRLTMIEQRYLAKRLESRSRYDLVIDLLWLVSHIRFTQPKTKAELKKSPNTTKKHKNAKNVRIYRYKNLASYPLADWVLRRYYKCRWTPPPSNSTSSKSTKSVRTYLNLRSVNKSIK